MSIELFRRAADYARDVMAALPSDDLRLRTPCADWDLARLILHVADSADGLVGLAETGDLAMPDPPRVDAPAPVSVAYASMERLAATLSTAAPTEATASAADAGAIELTMHGWDIGVARDPRHATPAELANDVYELASALVLDDARGSRFGPRITVPPDASPSDRLAGFLGRRPPVAVTGRAGPALAAGGAA